jgi:hypothetical protein
MLARSNDAALKDLAAQEQRGVDGAKEQVALAEAWWKIAETRPNKSRGAIQNHAIVWYRRALPQLVGLEKAKVEKRLAQVEKESTPRNWQDDFHFSQTKAMGQFVRIGRNTSTAKNHIRSKRSYDGGVELTMVVRTDSTNIRISACQASIILNWEVRQNELRVMRPGGCRFSEKGSPILDMKKLVAARVQPLQANRWYKIRWIITSKGMALFVDKRLVFKETRAYSLPSSPVMVYGSHGSVVDIKSFSVRRLR